GGVGVRRVPGGGGDDDRWSVPREKRGPPARGRGGGGGGAPRHQGDRQQRERRRQWKSLVLSPRHWDLRRVVAPSHSSPGARMTQKQDLSPASHRNAPEPRVQTPATPHMWDESPGARAGANGSVPCSFSSSSSPS